MFRRNRSGKRHSSRRRNATQARPLGAVESLEHRQLLAADLPFDLTHVQNVQSQLDEKLSLNLVSSLATSHLVDSEVRHASIYFVDPGVEDHANLISQLNRAGLDRDESTQIVLLDPTRDGIEQITSFLQRQVNLGTVHILSHGDSGMLRLGSTELTAGNLPSYASQLSQWKRALVSGGDILIYGCKVADGTWGMQLVDELSETTGADVAAST
ncbi:MAG: DUF4347 domain-containing protein, partial [Planctomycetales bacterium]|nr:DUF4347 domain-containing protein [Planctomycetales bacterium]